MFSEFEGNADERKAKLDKRLATLKRAREDGFFDEEGTESVDIVHDGVNPCDPASTQPFDPDWKQKFDKFNRPLKDKRGTYECYKCKGFGDEIRYGEIVGRCRACGGVGRLSDVLQAIDMTCVRCDGFGHDVWGTTCDPCHGTGVRPDLEPA